MKNIIYNDFIRVDKFIYTHFNIFIIIVYIIFLLIHFLFYCYFENFDFDFFLL